MATQDYSSVKNASVLVPTTASNLGTPCQPYGNIYVQSSVTIGANSGGATSTITATSGIVPKIASLTYANSTTAANPAGSETVTVNGSGFLSGAIIYLNNVPVNTVNVVSSTTITFVTPAMAAGNYSFSVVNSDGGSGTFVPGINYTTVPVWSTASGGLGNAHEGNSVSVSVAATDGSQNISYSVVSGSLPTGLSLSNTGIISGTLATSTPGNTTYNFTIGAADPQNQIVNRNFSYVVTGDTITINSPSNGTSYTKTINSAISNITVNATSAFGNTITYTANFVPSGLNLNSSTGVISGTPNVIGSTTSKIFANTNSHSANIVLTFNVQQVAPTWSTTAGSLGSGNEGNSVSIQLSADDQGSPVTYAVTANSIPNGLTLASNGLMSGTLATSASGNTTYTFTVAANNAYGGSTTRSFNYVVTGDTVTINSPANNSNQSFLINNAISNVTINATSAFGNTITFSANTSLPNGLSLNSSTGVISGTPNTFANSTVKVFANTNSHSANIVMNFAITETNPTWVTSAGSLGSANEGNTVSISVTATDNNSPVTYSVTSGSLPGNLTLSSSGNVGTISGTLANAASAGNNVSNFTITASNPYGGSTARAFSYTVVGDTLTWSSPTSGTTFNEAGGSAITPITLSATSGFGKSITYSATNLPSGLSLSGNTISGTAPLSYANTAVTLTATTSTKTSTETVYVNVFNANYQITYLVVGGGGSGNWSGMWCGAGSGGGAGGLVNSTACVSAGTSYTVHVGTGGACGASGTNSYIGCLVIGYGGGGGGGNRGGHTACAGFAGGSGGGGGNWSGQGGAATQPCSAYGGFGYAGSAGGGNGWCAYRAGTGGAGGGAGGAGGTVCGQWGGGSNGGIGKQITQFANYGYPAGWFAGGGAGNSLNSGIQNGGKGGGGGAYCCAGTRKSCATYNAGQPNTGGGAAAQNQGGSGIVVIMYTSATQRGTGGTVTSSGSGASTVWYHAFTGSGTYVA